MKFSFTFLVAILISFVSSAQTLQSGAYEPGLYLAYDQQTQKLTGYFEDHTGWDEELKYPKFSCLFYIEGKLNSNNIQILTYYPDVEENYNDTIMGTFEIIDKKTIKIKLPMEHGGCWNVQHFAENPVQFNLYEKYNWSQIRYVTKEKTFFYQEKNEAKRQKAYLIKSDFVCVDKIDGEWAHCTFLGEHTTMGWIKNADLNKW